MEFREIKSMVALDECGSIRDAAKSCNLSPAAVHKHLKTIERELGVQVYQKWEGRLRLTEAGKIALPFAREILLHHEAAFAAIEEWKDGGRGMVRVGAGPSFSSYLLPPIVKRFRRLFPRVDVYVETGESSHLMSHLKSGSLDLAFDLAAAALEDKNLEQVARWEAHTGFISAKARFPAPCRLKTLEHTPFILFRKGTLMESVIQNYLNSLNFRPSVVMRSDSAEAIKAMIRTGLGISVLFLWNIGSDPGGLSVLRTDAPPLALRMALIRLKSGYTPKVVNEFIKLAGGMNWKNLHLVQKGA
jgi:DNA-binding transcriptional LysR family regulator